MGIRKAWIILVLLVLIGFALRVYRLGENSFVTDEFLDINSTYGYFRTGDFVAWDFNLDRMSDNQYAPRDTRAPFYRWQVAQLFRWFPPTEAVARSVSVFWGLISIIGIYFFGLFFTKRREIGLIGAFLFAVSPLGIELDRMLRLYAMFFPTYMFFSWAFFLFVEGEYRGRSQFLNRLNSWTGLNFFWFFPLLILGYLSWKTDVLAGHAAISVMGYFIFYAVFSAIKDKKIISKYLVYFLLVLAGITLFFIFFPRNLAAYSGYFDFFKTNKKYLIAPFFDYSNVFLASSLFFIGIFNLWKKLNLKKEAIWLASAFGGIVLTAFASWKVPFGERFIFFAMPFSITLIASGIFCLVKLTKVKVFKNNRKVFLSVFIILLLIIPDYSYFFSKNNTYHQSENRPDYRRIYKTITDQSNQGDALITRNFRSYYYPRSGLKVIDIKSGKKVTFEELAAALREHRSVWLVFEDGKKNFDKKAIEIIKNQFTLSEEIGGMKIYHWSKSGELNSNGR